MRRLVLVLVLAFGVAPSALAQPAPPAPVEEPRRLDTMSQRDREREMQATQWQGPSGFWTSPHKSSIDEACAAIAASESSSDWPAARCPSSSNWTDESSWRRTT